MLPTFECKNPATQNIDQFLRQNNFWWATMAAFYTSFVKRPIQGIITRVRMRVNFSFFHTVDLCVCIDLGSLIGNAQCGNFSIFLPTQILREINFGHFEAPKTAILIIWAALNFGSLGTFDFSKSFKMVQKAVFYLLKSAKIDFT